MHSCSALYSQLILDNEQVLKFKTKAQLLYGASKIMRQQSYLLYGMHTHYSYMNASNIQAVDDSNELWSKLKSDMLNPTVSSFIDMDKSVPTQVSCYRLVFSTTCIDTMLLDLVLLRYLMLTTCCSFKYLKGLLYSHLWYVIKHACRHHSFIEHTLSSLTLHSAIKSTIYMKRTTLLSF